jgi:hypothetical protein
MQSCSILGLIALILLAAGKAVAQDSARATRQRLSEPQVISGVPCDATPYAKIYPSGALESCPLVRDTTIGSHALPKGTWVHLTPEGRLKRVWLPGDWTLQNHRCRGAGNEQWSVLFHESGGLSLCYLADVEVIDGAPCQRGTFWGEVVRTVRKSAPLATTFYPDGSLESCQAATDVVLDGVAYKKGERIHRKNSAFNPGVEPRS